MSAQLDEGLPPDCVPADGGLPPITHVVCVTCHPQVLADDLDAARAFCTATGADLVPSGVNLCVACVEALHRHAGRCPAGHTGTIGGVE